MHGLTILIVDDEAFISRTLAFKFAKLGATVHTAANGREGLALAQAHRPDVILSDYQMPVVSGYDMCVQLRQHEPTSHTPVLMLTARGHRLSAAELAKTNIVQLFPKPFSANELVHKITELFPGRTEPTGTDGPSDTECKAAAP